MERILSERSEGLSERRGREKRWIVVAARAEIAKVIGTESQKGRGECAAKQPDRRTRRADASRDKGAALLEPHNSSARC